METKIYKTHGGGVRPPSLSRIQRILFFLFKMPIIHKFANKLLRKSLKLNASITIHKGFFVSTPYLKVGNNTCLGDTFIRAVAPVTIGSNCSFSYRNMILTGTHDYKDFSKIIAKPVIIGNNVWITSNVTILPGVTIGDNTIIGVGSIVTKDIPSGVFAAGNPCKVIKKIDFKIN